MVASQAASSAECAKSFGPFRLIPRRRLLLEAGRPVHVGSRALDLLIALIERPGELLRKDELLTRVWRGTHVVEGNLKFQIAELRRVLRDGQEGRRYLETSPGQGYRFVADVTVESGGMPAMADVASLPNKHNLPTRLAALIGRDNLVAKLIHRLPAERLVTIVGPGGIGKTSAAIATAEKLIGAYEDGAWLVDLARLADPSLVWSAVAAVVGADISPGDPPGSLVAALRARQMLLVLDDCTHLVDVVATLVVGILKSAPGVHILATSREPLRVEGEHVYRLAPLESPPASDRLTAVEALRFPAVRLFVERAAASDGGFELRDDMATSVGEICRKLDGIPLAIELAAARVDVLGVWALAARLEHRLRILTSGRRTALPHHRTMRATLDWSFGLLNAPEQTIFPRLAVFAGGFTLAAAAAVADDASHSADEIVELVLELAAKSLVTADVDGAEPRFRLLETTRAYALEKLDEGGAAEAIRRRHARYFLRVFDAVSSEDAEFDKRSAALALEIDNLRAALGWAFTRPGDLPIGIGLAAASMPLWLSMSLIGEWHVWTEKAIHSLDEAGLRGTRQEMMLQAALGISFQLVRNRTAEAHAALTRALDLAEHLGDADYQLRIVHTFWIYHMRVGEVRTSLVLADRAGAIAASLPDPAASATAEWMLGISLHFGGEHAPARRRLEHLLRQDAFLSSRNYFIRRTSFDLCVPARYVLARILWVQGYPDQAMQAVRASIEEARLLESPSTLCGALGLGGCALSIRCGDFDNASRLAAELVAYAQQHALADWVAFGEAVQDILLLWTGNSNTGADQFDVALQRWRASRWHLILTIDHLAEVAEKAECADEIAAIVDEELERAERDQELWALPETLRVKGELLLLRHDPDADLAREHFLRSLDCARAQGALSWELRTAMSLARLERAQGRRTEKMYAFLQSICDRFTEGFDTVDLKRARRLLDGPNAASG